MTMDRHSTAGARLVEYVLGELAPQERLEIERHLRECAECSADVAELTLVMQGLAGAVDPVTPRPALKQRVLEALSRERQEGTVDAAADVSGARRDRRTWGGARPLRQAQGWLAAAAAIVILVLGGALYLSVERGRRIASGLQRAESDATDLQRRLDDFAGQTDLALSILTAGDMRRIDLAGSDASRNSAARAYWSPTRGLLVVADRLPVPPPGRIYQVWIIGGGGPVSAGLLGAQRTGRGMLVAPPPGGVSSGPITIAVTDEPPGGLPSPTGMKHFIGSL